MTGYRVVPPTRVRGVSIPRTVPPIYIVVDPNGRRVDGFLAATNAAKEVRRLNSENAQHDHR